VDGKLGLISWLSGHLVTSLSLDIAHNQRLKLPQQPRHILTWLAGIIAVRLASDT